jgi:hypothetical protein
MSETKFGEWTAPQANAVAVEYSLVVIEEIRQAVTEGYQRFARGGIEVGGILFGTYDGKTIRILAVREIACEHARGPSFILSDKDRAVLAEQLERDRLDVRLEGFQPVGFYVSHTRSDIFMQPADQETYEAFFPELWQVALVVKPGRAGVMRAGFFVREADGTLKTDASYLDFNFPDRLAMPASHSERAPMDRRPLSSERRGMPAFDAAAGVDSPEAGYAQRALPFQDTPQPAEPQYADAQPSASAWAPEYTPYPDEGSRWKRWAIVLVVVLAVALLAFVGVRYFAAGSPSEPISLSIFEHQVGQNGEREGQLLIEWNRNAAPIRNASEGTLEITDGKDMRTVMLSKDTLSRGSFTYERLSGDVQVRLEVQNANGEKTQEASRFLGTPPRTADANEMDTLKLERDALKDELTRLRNENAAQQERNQQLERTNTILRLRLGIASPTKR